MYIYIVDCSRFSDSIEKPMVESDRPVDLWGGSR